MLKKVKPKQGEALIEFCFILHRLGLVAENGLTPYINSRLFTGDVMVKMVSTTK
jgi:hypothetical protein